MPQPTPTPTGDSATYHRVRREQIAYPQAGWDAILSAQPGRELALDAGCGTGLVTQRLAEGGFARVVGVDTSEQQLAVAPRLPGVEYRVAPAHATGLEDGSVDLVTAGSALHWWACGCTWGAGGCGGRLRLRGRVAVAGAPRDPAPPNLHPAPTHRFDAPAFYSEARRVLKPGGALAAFTHGLSRLTQHPAAEAANERWREAHLMTYLSPRLRCVVEEDGYRGERQRLQHGVCARGGGGGGGGGGGELTAAPASFPPPLRPPTKHLQAPPPHLHPRPSTKHRSPTHTPPHAELAPQQGVEFERVDYLTFPMPHQLCVRQLVDFYRSSSMAPRYRAEHGDAAWEAVLADLTTQLVEAAGAADAEAPLPTENTMKLVLARGPVPLPVGGGT